MKVLNEEITSFKALGLSLEANRRQLEKQEL
jgi:hypothetical protein